MRLKMYSIRDSKGEIFNTPYFAKTHGEAERNFTALVKDPKSMPGQFPDDFDLYHCGEYDDQTGIGVWLPTPEHVMKAVLALQKNN